MLDLLFGRKRPRANAPAGDWLSGDEGMLSGRTRAQVNVNENLALTYSAVWSATRLLAEGEAGLPLVLYHRLKGGDREQAAEHPLYETLKYSPNPTMGSVVWRIGQTAHQINWGQGFSEIERIGRQIALWPIHPQRVRPARQGEDPNYPYLVKQQGGSEVRMRADEILHVPGTLSDDGIWGKGVISYARETVGLGIATERHGAAYFGAGALGKGALFLPGVKDKEVRRKLRAEIREVHGSPDSAEFMLLPPEGKYQPFGIPNDAAQFLQTRQHNILEIARWYRVPPHLLMDLQSGASYASVEVMSLEFVIYSLLPWVRLWEEQLELKLLTPAERSQFFIEHSLGGLLRGDIKSRMDAYKTALMYGMMTLNEIRRLENLNSIGEIGDVHFFPANMTTVEKLIQAPVPSTISVGVPGAMPAEDGQDTAGTPSEEGKEPPGDLSEGQSAALENQMQSGLQNGELRQLQTSTQTAEKILLASLERWYTKEANAARRVAADPKRDFDGWRSEFFAEQMALMVESLTPAASALADISILPMTAQELTAFIADKSKADLERAYSTLTKKQFEKAMDNWARPRARRLTKQLLEQAARENGEPVLAETAKVKRTEFVWDDNGRPVGKIEREE